MVERSPLPDGRDVLDDSAARLSAATVARAVAFRAGEHTPAQTRDAATVVLVRESRGGPEVYLLRRVQGMTFAGGMYAFPGGSVDPADAEAAIGWSGPPSKQFAAAFDCSEPLARALVCAAVRETFEEAGVLLAGLSAEDALSDTTTTAWEAERVALETREQSLCELLSRRALVLRADLLRPLARWITPEVEPKRFDTRFFLAKVPPGQVCRAVGGEADERLWVRPRDALQRRLPMLPATALTLHQLAGGHAVSDLFMARREIRPLMPRLIPRDDGTVAVEIPGLAGYDL